MLWRLLKVIVILALIVLAFGLLWRYYPTLSKLPGGPLPPVTTPEDAPTLHLGSVDLPLTTALTASYEDPYYKVSVKLANPGAGNLETAASLADDVLAGYADTFDPAKLTAEDKSVMRGSAAGKYTLDLVGKRTTGQSDRWSYRIETSAYTGGAHGLFAVAARSYDAEGNRLSLAEATGLASPLPALAEAARPRLLEAISAKMRENGSADPYQADENFDGGTAPTAENYSTWYLSGDSIVVGFNEYQVGAYSLGEYEVPVPLADLAS